MRDLSPMLAKVLARVDFADCWEWTGPVDRDGYGKVSLGAGINRRPHRVVWEGLVARIDAGLHIDHLCKNRRCVNPDHIQPVTPQENIRRSASRATLNASKTHCAEGHPYDAVNTYHYKGRRDCRICRRAAGRRSRARQRRTRPVWSESVA